MKKRPAISVVIPAFNEEKYLSFCLASLQKQTFKNYEIIVVDNNSTDKTAQIAKKFGAKIVKEKKQGMIPARERGFRQARGELIARTDADSLLPPDWLTKIYHTFQKNPHIVAITGSYHDFPEVGRLTKWFLQLYVDIGFYKLNKLLMGHFPLSGPNNAVRTKVWRKTKVCLDDKLVHEDLDLACHLSHHGEILYYPGLTATYSMRRWKRNFWYTLSEYGRRYLRTIFFHHPFFSRHKSLAKIRETA